MEKFITIEEAEKEFFFTLESFIDKGNKLTPEKIHALLLDLQAGHIDYMLYAIDKHLKEMKIEEMESL